MVYICIPPNTLTLVCIVALPLLVNSSAKNSLKRAENVVFFLFCILVDRPMRRALLELTKSDLKHLLKHIFRGANCQKFKSQINENKSQTQKQTIKFDRKCKNAKHRFFLQIYYKLRSKERGAIQCQLIINHFSQISFH